MTGTDINPLPGLAPPLDSRGLWPMSPAAPPAVPVGRGPCELCGHMVPSLPAEPVPQIHYHRDPYYICPASDADGCDKRKAAREAAERAPAPKAAVARPRPSKARSAALKAAPAGDDAA